MFAESFIKYFNERAKLSESNEWIGKSTAANVLTPIYLALRSIKLNLQQLLKERRIDWSIQASIGQGAATPDHYIALLPRGQKVSNGIYYCLCFDRNGNGCVGGAMTSLLTNQHLDEKTVERAAPLTTALSKNTVWELREPNKINVWSRNNAFYNPMEFSRDFFGQSPNVADQLLIEHIETSRQIILNLISRKKSFS